MSDIKFICFKMIAGAGEARTNFVNAVEASKQNNLKLAEELIEKGDQAFQEGHVAHASLLQKEANGEKQELGLLLMHAEDQLLSCEAFRYMALELMEIYKKFACDEVKQRGANDDGE